MTLTDKTGAPVTITRSEAQFTIGVEGRNVGLAAFADHDEQRVFYHTEIDPAYGGRGLATVLIEQALSMTRSEGKRIVAVCPMVAGYVRKHHEFDDILDEPTPEIIGWLSPGV